MSNAQSQSSGELTAVQFAAHFRESSRVLWCVAAGVLGDRTHAEDVLQEAAVAALGKLDSFQIGTSFVAWMSQVVRFVALNHRRKRERRRRMLDARDASTTAVPPTAGDGGETLFDRDVAQALASLSEAQRTCLLLKTVVELEYREIASLLEMPAGTAMSHVSRARTKMQSLLEPERRAIPHEAVQ